MPITITDVVARDIRFPTSRALDGSDAMNRDPDYSAAYVVLETDEPDGLEGHGLTFTIGRGNELCVAAIEALAPLVRRPDARSRSPPTWARSGGGSPATASCAGSAPRRASIHLATAAVVNAVWDLWAKVEGKPLWKLLADMTPEQLVRCIDFRYITDALTPDEALDDPAAATPATRRARGRDARATAIPAYTTSAGWLGYSDDKMRRLCREAIASGWTHFKMKVGARPRRTTCAALRHHPRGDRRRTAS